jgi:hypothetical protein
MKEEYQIEVEKLLKNLTPERIKTFQDRLDTLRSIRPRKYARIDFASGSTCTGDFILNSQNVLRSFSVHDSQNIRYSFKMVASKDCWDVTDWGDPAELCYESITIGKGSYRVLFSTNCWPGCRELQYCDSCVDSRNLFGCIGLKNASFCILNKSYTEQEYHKFVQRIIADMKQRGEYGEFFPPKFSPFAYNESVAQNYFPLDAKEAKQRGLGWREAAARDYQVTLFSRDLPETAQEVNPSIIEEVIGCAHEGKCADDCVEAFKITKEELSFYKSFGLPLPRLCFNCRHAARLKKRNPFKLWHRTCQCGGAKSESGIYTNVALHPHHDNGHCPNEFESSYAPEGDEIVYCGACYHIETA